MIRLIRYIIIYSYEALQFLEHIANTSGISHRAKANWCPHDFMDGDALEGRLETVLKACFLR